MSPRIIIGIINWNGKRLLENCLDSLFRNTDYGNYEVIVLDNGSSDGSVEMVKRKYDSVSIIENDENLGLPSALNQIFNSKIYEEPTYYVFLNNDIKFTEPGWLRKLVNISELDNIGIVGCVNLTSGGNIDHQGAYLPLSDHSKNPVNFNDDYMYNTCEHQNSCRDFDFIDLVQSSIIVIDKGVVDDIGGFDEGYSPIYYDEYDYCIRAWNAGYKVAIAKNVEIMHQGQQSDFRKNEWLFHLKKNELRFILINYPLSWLISSIPGFILPPHGLLLFFINKDNGVIQLSEDFKKNPIETLILAGKTFTDNLFDLPEILQKRKERSCIKSLLK